jgi:hypothetical protein
MEPASAPVTPIVFQERDTDTAAHAHLTGARLQAVRAVWVALVVLSLAAFVASVPLAHQIFLDQGPRTQMRSRLVSRCFASWVADC